MPLLRRNHSQRKNSDGCVESSLHHSFKSVINGDDSSTYASNSIKQLPILSFLNVSSKEINDEKLCQPFRNPWKHSRSTESERLSNIKTLGVRRRLVSIHSGPIQNCDLQIETDYVEPLEPAIIQQLEEIEPEIQKPSFEPLILWQHEEEKERRVVVPDILTKFLRPHQRDGVQFLFDCVADVENAGRFGCILADDMGLGKTLQSITLMHTLLETSMQDPTKPTIHRVIIVCPTSLVKNWNDEIQKWLQNRIKTIALFESNREHVIKEIYRFIDSSCHPHHRTSPTSSKVLILSYETFRMHAAKFHSTPKCCDLLICDEAHRLKNSHSQINRALAALACRRRVLLSGTPMQNDLEEFYAMVDFTNPDILGTPAKFRKQFMGPILRGREPDATDKEQSLAQGCSWTLCNIVNQFILRRGNTLNAKHLPPKLMQVICCPLSSLQEKLYKRFLESKAMRNIMKQQNVNVLPSITALKKLCNHPLLLFKDDGTALLKLPGFEDCQQIIASEQKNNFTSGQRAFSTNQKQTCHPGWSGKLQLLDHLMQMMRKETKERIVVVSNYTQTLDLVSLLCSERNWPFVRLDGTISPKKRQQMVDVFNDPTTHSFAFLLSSKAGGCGLNLIGANRLVLFDPDWNPATDKQAAARVWREGQKQMCYVYRFLATGSLEEKIFQRQLSKEGLQSIVDDKDEVNSLSSKDLKKLFVLQEATESDTHDRLRCTRCKWRLQENDIDSMRSPNAELNEAISETPLSHEYFHAQIGLPREEDLNNWGHHRCYDSVDDEIMQKAMRQLQLSPDWKLQSREKSKVPISFAFSCRIDSELLLQYQEMSEVKNAEENIQAKEISGEEVLVVENHKKCKLETEESSDSSTTSLVSFEKVCHEKASEEGSGDTRQMNDTSMNNISEEDHIEFIDIS
uniref:DNA repair and recombination protein RAD54 putative n=1 Tax=Albugo laibachii Nc14 TaxID=890382 RepID=F0WUV5_9STRA|nr:DNA repair and recombination protein RAD54 putative [Albugo laibachii Nc14]|eukprot:CCA25191.1 DNA repair and recombination protein RAD54 putative [Albugo laibachii Nc14]